MMNLNEHIKWQRAFDDLHGWNSPSASEEDLFRLVMLDVIGIASELGELSHHVKYSNMENRDISNIKESVGGELVDILIYCFRIFGHLNIDAEEVIKNKRVLNEKKFERFLK